MSRVCRALYFNFGTKKDSANLYLDIIRIGSAIKTQGGTLYLAGYLVA